MTRHKEANNFFASSRGSRYCDVYNMENDRITIFSFCSTLATTLTFLSFLLFFTLSFSGSFLFFLSFLSWSLVGGEAESSNSMFSILPNDMEKPRRKSIAVLRVCERDLFHLREKRGWEPNGVKSYEYLQPLTLERETVPFTFMYFFYLLLFFFFIFFYASSQL